MIEDEEYDIEEPLHKRDDSNFSFKIKESFDITNPSTIFESRKQTHTNQHQEFASDLELFDK